MTARIWVARARFRNAPREFPIYRDEILQAAGIGLDEVREYLKRYEEQPVGATKFSRRVKGYVDSIESVSGY